jgi:hypothetical protein
MRVEKTTTFMVGLLVATFASGVIYAATDDAEGQGSAQARPPARSSPEPTPTPSSAPPDTPSPTPTPTEDPASADDESYTSCVPTYHVPLPKFSPVVDPETGLTTFKETYETPDPVEHEDCVPGYGPWSYDSSHSFPGSSWQTQPTNAPGYYPPGFGDGASETGTGKDRRVPITTDRGGPPDLAPTVPRAPVARVPAFIP